MLTSSEAESARKFEAHFVIDIEEKVFEDDELVQFDKQYPTEAVSTPAWLRRMRENRIFEACANVIAVANTEGERSFSVLKRVKNQFRSTVGQDKRCDLVHLTIETDFTNGINFECIVSEFAKLKSRKKQLRYRSLSLWSDIQ